MVEWLSKYKLVATIFFLSLMIISMVSMQIIAKLTAPVSIDQQVIIHRLSKLRGGPAVTVLKPRANYDPVSYELRLISISDRDGDMIEDELENYVKGLNSTSKVGIVVWWAVKPVPFGGDRHVLFNSLLRAMNDVIYLGGNITHGPWMNALVGFSAKVPVSILKTLASTLSSLDVDGDGVSDRFLIALDKEYHALNYWSSRQMNIRPWVWINHNVTGRNVTVVVIDTGIDGKNTAFQDKIIYWKDYVGDPDGNKRDTPYDDNMHGTHVAGTVAGYYTSLDDQGRLITNFGIGDIDLSGASSGYYYRFGGPYGVYYVNATGTIQLDFKWKPDSNGAIGGVAIGFCGNLTYDLCTPTIVASVSTPNSDTWYNVTYNVDSPSKYGFYVWLFEVNTPGYVAMLPILHYPVSKAYTDKIPFLAGMAPDAKLGGAKVLSYYGSGSSSTIASAVDDVVSARTSYNPPLYVISMSLGGGYDSTLESSVTNAVQSGVLVVVAAGNDGVGQNYAGNGSPSADPYAVTIAATGALNNITDYSSQGGPSQDDNNVIKPDIAAPGGGNVLMIFSADTTWHDDLNNWYCSDYIPGWGCLQYSEDLDWLDTININTTGYDDSMGISGTSMATPHVSGASALVIDALVNHAGLTWDWNSASSPLFVKNILLISAYETYPLLREYNGSNIWEAYSPTLDKGGKDVHEGYGALDALAAVELALSMGKGQALLPGSIVDESFRPGVIYGGLNEHNGEWRYPFGRSVYASRIYFPVTSFTLSNGSSYDSKYAFKLYSLNNDQAHTDLDLYIYRLAGDSYGEPVILASSTNGFNSNESVFFTPASQGVDQVIIAVKRAREDSAGGSWRLVVGPFINITGYSYNGSTSSSSVWIGWPVKIAVLSAARGDHAVVEVFDNTTGTLLDRETITLNDTGTFSYGELNYTVPYDNSLVNHTLVFITTIKDSNGNTLSGPVITTATVEESPAPIPELGGITLAIVVGGSALVAIVLIRRRNKVNE